MTTQNAPDAVNVLSESTLRMFQLQALVAAARSLVTVESEEGKDLTDALDTALADLVQILPHADLVAVLLHDPASDCLRLAASVGFDNAVMRQLVLRPGESISGKVFRGGRPLLLPTPQAVAEAMNDMSAHNKSIFSRATGGLPPQSAIAVPLTTNGQRLGALVLESFGRPAGITAEDQPFAEALANLITLAIDRGRLRDQVDALVITGKASQVRADILSAISHELRTPLASIKGYATALMLDEVEWEEDRRREFLQMIDEECYKLEAIVHDFLDAAKIEAGRLEIEFQPVMLPRIAQEEVDAVARHTSIHRFLLDFPPNFPVLDADEVRIGQVLRNLLDNAVKYSPHGGLIVVRGIVREDEVVLGVSDQGVGIAPEDLNQLFERFFRVKAAAGYHVPGSGLGLPISQSIIEAHGGRIWAESQVGKGTTLYFTLPRTGLSAEIGEEGE